MVDDKIAHRAAVDAGYASLQGYIEQWGHEVVEQTQKRYADDITVQELVRLRVENERLREALREALSFYAEWGIDAPAIDAIIEHDRGDIARAALQQKESE